MCGAMAVAAMLFKTDPFEMIDFAEYQFSSQAMSFQEFISGYIPFGMRRRTVRVGEE